MKTLLIIILTVVIILLIVFLVYRRIMMNRIGKVIGDIFLSIAKTTIGLDLSPTDKEDKPEGKLYYLDKKEPVKVSFLKRLKNSIFTKKY